MKKKLIALFILILLIYTIEYPYWYEEISWNPFDYARITDVDYKAIVIDEPNDGGKVLITERLTFDVHAASEDNPYWELWRDLPEDYVDGMKVEYKVNSVKQILEDGTELVYQKSPKLYWDDYDYINTSRGLGPGKWYHSEGPYDESARQYECLLFYVDGLYREEVIFEIEYEMSNAALRYNDCSELYISMYSEDTIKYLESFKGEILIPNKDMPSDGNYEAHTYGTNSHDFIYNEYKYKNPGYYTFSFNLDESDLQFKPYNEYIEFALISYGDDKHIFTEYAPSNAYSRDDVLAELRYEQRKYESLPKDFLAGKIIVLIFALGTAGWAIHYSFKIDDRMKQKHIFYESAIPMDYCREIPSNLDPTFAAALVFCKDEPAKEREDGYAAIMLSLVRKGYIELDKIRFDGDWNFYNIKIIIKPKPAPLQPVPDLLEPYYDYQDEREPLTLTEEHYFNLIVRHSYGTEIPMSTFQARISADYENTDSFVRNIQNSTINIGISQGYFQKADYEQPKREIKKMASKLNKLGILLLTLVNFISYQTRLELAFGAFFIAGIAFIISARKLKKVAKNYVLLTQFGEDEYVKWKGLYNYLNSEMFMNECTITDLPRWEQYLVYATAFGISEKVINVLNIKCPEVNSSPILQNRYYRSRSFYHSHRSFRRTAHTTSHSVRTGGYGGGWRIRWRRPWWRWRRRWSLVVTVSLIYKKRMNYILEIYIKS